MANCQKKNSNYDLQQQKWYTFQNINDNEIYMVDLEYNNELKKRYDMQEIENSKVRLYCLLKDPEGNMSNKNHKIYFHCKGYKDFSFFKQ